MPTGPAKDLPDHDEERSGSLLGPTPSTYSYNDALLMGKMTPGELAKVRSELFGEEIDLEPPDSTPTVPSTPAPPVQSAPPPPPSKAPSASGAWSPAKASTPPPPPKGPRSIPPPPLPPEASATEGKPASRPRPPPLPPEARRSVPPPPPPAAKGASKAPPPLPASAKQASKPKPPPMPQRTPAQQIKAKIDANDYAGALGLCERELLAAPESVEIQRYAEACRAMLARAYLGHLGRRSDVPRIVMGGAQLRSINLDRWAAFVMSRVDGDSSIDEIVDISGMVELDTLRILYELVQQGVVGISPRR